MMEGRPRENTKVHTWLMRFGFGMEESRDYWRRFSNQSASEMAEEAFEKHWFGPVSEQRVKTILASMALRYDAYPEAMAVLTQWREMEPATRRNIVHWHLQLADPIYRDFTGIYLLQRRETFHSDVHHDLVVRWIEQKVADRWGLNSKRNLATRLIGAAKFAGLLVGNKDPRTPVFPQVTDEALSYALRLFRSVEIQGDFLDNLYLRSVGLSDGFLSDRLRILSDVKISRQGNLIEFQTPTPDLKSWWEARAA